MTLLRVLSLTNWQIVVDEVLIWQFYSSIAYTGYGYLKIWPNTEILWICNTHYTVALIDCNNIQPFKEMMSIVCIKNGITIYIDKITFTWTQFMVRGIEGWVADQFSDNLFQALYSVIHIIWLYVIPYVWKFSCVFISWVMFHNKKLYS